MTGTTAQISEAAKPVVKQETVADLKAALIAEGLLTQAKIDAVLK